MSARKNECLSQPDQGTDAPMSLAFAIVTPDAVMRGIHLDVLRYIEKAGFRLLAHRPKYLTDSDVEYLYKCGMLQKVFTGAQTHWHITRKGFRMDVAIGVLLAARGAGAVKRLRNLKGKSNPFDCRVQSIRGHFRSFSKTLALLHSSDDQESMRREARLFFSDEVVEDYVNATTPKGCGADHFQTVDEVAMTLCRSNPNDSPFLVTEKIQWRIVNRLAWRWDETLGQQLPLLFPEVFSEFDVSHRKKHLSLVNEETLFRESQARVRKFVSGVQWSALKNTICAASIRDSSLDCATDLLLVQIVESLATPDASLLDPKMLKETLKVKGVRHNEWELLLLENYQFFYSESVSTAQKSKHA